MRLSFDFLAKGSFQTTADGQRLFYPNGVIGKSYLIESEELYQRLFRQQKHWGLAIMTAITLLMLGKASGLIVLAAFIALNLLKQTVVRRTTRHLPISATRYSISHFLHDSLPIHKLSQRLQIALFASCALGCLTLALLAASGWHPEIRRRLITWSVICGLIAYLALRTLRSEPPLE